MKTEKNQEGLRPASSEAVAVDAYFGPGSFARAVAAHGEASHPKVAAVAASLTGAAIESVDAAYAEYLDRENARKFPNGWASPSAPLPSVEPRAAAPAPVSPTADDARDCCTTCGHPESDHVPGSCNGPDGEWGNNDVCRCEAFAPPAPTADEWAEVVEGLLAHAFVLADDPGVAAARALLEKHRSAK